jgi:membrane associated rhomboid family serine protease
LQHVSDLADVQFLDAAADFSHAAAVGPSQGPPLPVRQNGGGVAFFAHVGGFIFGFIVARWLTKTGRVEPQDYDSMVGAPA